MTTEEWVEQSREVKRRQFGEIGLHEDCANYSVRNERPHCSVCGNVTDTNKHKLRKLQCQKTVCYFYEPKRKEK